MLDYDAQNGGEWTKNVRCLLRSLDKEEHWTLCLPVNIDSAKIDLIKMFKETWKEEVATKPKLRTYAKVKDCMGTEAYLRANVTKHKCSLISQLRCGTLGLQIEMGRFSNTPVEDRTCKLCNGTVETEFHFLFECPSYENEHTSLKNNITELKNCVDNTSCFKVLNEMPYVFANFIDILWDKHNKLIVK